jgi:hypothetical protein
MAEDNLHRYARHEFASHLNMMVCTAIRETIGTWTIYRFLAVLERRVAISATNRPASASFTIL